MNKPACAAAALFTISIIAALAVACSDDDTPATTGTPAAASQPTPEPTIPIAYASSGPATFPVLAGRTEGNRDIEAFMPSDIRVRVGDTIEWTAHGFEGHTITFGDTDDILFNVGPYLQPDPDDPEQVIFNPTIALRSEKQGTHDGDETFINSGFIGVPAEAKYSLTFNEPGLYTYLCLVHPFTMTGTVTVDPAGAQVESPETIAARGASEASRYMKGLEDEADRLAEEAHSAPGPGDTTTHYVQVGAITDHGQIALYTPGNLDINAGDTVIFQNDDRNFHNVIFKGAGELPPGVGIIVDPDGRGINYRLEKASAAAVDPPPEGFDDKTFLSSGSLGVLQPRLNWTLKFDKPGTYQYACTIHALGGMVGVIVVH
jgi:plastocyanin